MMVQDTIKTLGVVDYLINSNGARVRDIKNNKDIHTNNISSENWHYFYNVIKDRNILFDVYAKESGFVEKRFESDYANLTAHTEFNEYFMKRYEFKDDLLKYLNDDTIEKISIFPKTTKEYDDVLNLLKIKNAYTLSSHSHTSVEINNLDTTKGEALLLICKELNIDLKNVMAFGDSDNDCHIISIVGCGIAMGNGFDKLKELAYYTTDTNVNSGVAKGIEKFIEL